MHKSKENKGVNDELQCQNILHMNNMPIEFSMNINAGVVPNYHISKKKIIEKGTIYDRFFWVNPIKDEIFLLLKFAAHMSIIKLKSNILRLFQ